MQEGVEVMNHLCHSLNCLLQVTILQILDLIHG